MRIFLHYLCLAFAFAAPLAPIAHVLEMPNKLRLDGPLWLAVQQHLYNGWGPLLGAPSELGALALSLILCVDRAARRWRLLAAAAYATMLIAFFAQNAPVNAEIVRWTAATLPPSWPAARLQWETGHAVAAIFACVGLAATLRASRVA